MKKIIFGVIACALLAIVACERKDDVRTVSFRATLSDQEAPSKAVVALNGSSNPQTFWENGDQITVYTQADGDTPNSAGYTFSTTLGANATSATFSYTGDGCEEGNYLAIYPAATAKRTVNFTGADDIYKMAAVDIHGEPASKIIMYRDNAAAICPRCQADNGDFSRVVRQFIRWKTPEPDAAAKAMISRKVLGD